MDTQTAYAELIKLAQSVTSGQCMTIDYYEAMALAERILDLDTRIQKGGLLPDEWDTKR